MSGLYDIELMSEVQDELIRELANEFAELIAESIGPDGETYGDVQMSPGDRIAQFFLDAQSGQMDMLSFIAPHFAEKKARQYIADVKASPFIAHTYEAQMRQPNIWPTQAGLVSRNPSNGM